MFLVARECLLYKSLGKPCTPGNRNFAGSWCLANLVSRGGRFCILRSLTFIRVTFQCLLQLKNVFQKSKHLSTERWWKSVNDQAGFTASFRMSSASSDLLLNAYDKDHTLALKTDKDGGFCLVLKEALKHETELALNTGSRYSEVDFGHGFERTLLLEFAEAAFSAAEVAPLEDDDKKDFVSSLLQPARVSKAANVFACLKYTLKTHKPPGEVGFRALHSSVNTPLLGAMKFIASWLKPQLTALPHLLKRSADAVKQLQHWRVSPSAFLITIDIKDFFLDGNHAQITSACEELVEPPWRSSFLILVKFILDAQYLTSPCFPERMWKVNKGAGMGLQCSGELVDSTFFKTVEEGILPQLDRWRIVGYFRFKDDILVMCDSPREVLLDFVSTLKKASSVGKLKVESVSQTEARFLDLRLFKGAGWLATGCLDIFINHKVTAQKQPVAIHSLHPPRTHLSWPRSLVHRINTLCNSRMYQLEELSRLKCMIAEWCGWERVSLVFDHVRRRAPISNHSDVKVVGSRLIIPYHKEWEIGAIHSTLQRVLHRYAHFAFAVQCACDNVHFLHSADEAPRHSTVEFVGGWSWMEDGDGLTCKLFSPKGWPLLKMNNREIRSANMPENHTFLRGSGLIIPKDDIRSNSVKWWGR